MPYYLKHHFDPDTEHRRLVPEKQADGSVDHFELNYVQNVEAGNVIAEWVEVDEEEAGKLEPRYLFEERTFPAGRGTGIKHRHPDRLYAAVNGWVGYSDGRICVQEKLTIDKDVDYNTGNIDFIGNLTVRGCVRSGFHVGGRDVRIDGQIEGARVEALHSLSCRGGVKGSHEAFLESGKTMKLAFCENATLKAGEDVLVKGALMHSDVYAGRRLAVGGRLTGGRIVCHEYIYVGEQLGGGLDTSTRIILGYNPTLMYADEEYNARIRLLHDRIKTYEKQMSKGPDFREEFGPKLEAAIKELDLVKMLKVKLWEGIQGTECLDECKILVPGVVKPGVEISIGDAFLKVDDYFEDVYFYYENYEVKIGTSSKRLG